MPIEETPQLPGLEDEASLKPVRVKPACNSSTRAFERQAHVSAVTVREAEPTATPSSSEATPRKESPQSRRQLQFSLPCEVHTRFKTQVYERYGMEHGGSTKLFLDMLELLEATKGSLRGRSP
ncbi:hypothetical protein [Parvularcula dongshanensis]|uniref:Uncharacterized protein n=1 Tax=Parvularcula dongshanensis TaxID=1173995 RepID=A0A840I7L4_9PROT|nr:hypothetical protein [Parvularcula dongshanensis]MBB4659950.1 hypothetical protein [Parvularcula dongshanensis]